MPMPLAAFLGFMLAAMTPSVPFAGPTPISHDLRQRGLGAVDDAVDLRRIGDAELGKEAGQLCDELLARHGRPHPGVRRASAPWVDLFATKHSCANAEPAPASTRVPDATATMPMRMIDLMRVPSRRVGRPAPEARHLRTSQAHALGHGSGASTSVRQRAPHRP